MKHYKNKSKDEIIKILSKPKPKINFPEVKIEEIRERINELRYTFSKPKIKEIRKSLYEIENEKNLFTPKIKEIEKKSLLELEDNLFELKKYYDYGDTKYKGIRDVRNLLDL